MPELTWVGKDKVINHHLDVPYRVLEHQYTYGLDAERERERERNFQSENLIIHGDNLEALKALLPKYEGKVDCIYIDPPYNTGNEKWIYNDNVNDPRIKKWLGEVVGKEGDDLSRHDKWLCMMYPRLRLLHRLLAPTGVIFISIDDNEQANLRAICDEIFGKSNHMETFIWESSGNTNNQGDIIGIHEYIHGYFKDKRAAKINPIVDPNIPKESKIRRNFVENSAIKNGYKNPPIKITLPIGFPCSEEELFIPLDKFSQEFINETQEIGYISREIGKRYDAHYPLLIDDMLVKNGKLVKPVQVFSGWMNADKLRRFISNNCTPVVDGGTKFRFYITKTGAVYYHKEGRESQYVQSVLRNMGTTEKSKNSLEKMGLSFNYPKPIELISYLISMYTPKNGIVLDSFAGSGTTASSVLNLNNKNNLNYKFILIELEDYANSITSEHIKRVIENNKESKSSHQSRTESFSFYNLGDKLMIDGEINPLIPIEKIREYIWFTETRENYKASNSEMHPDFLGRSATDVSYFFAYAPEKATTLNRDYLSAISNESFRAESYVIYADICLLSDQELAELNITFKKIPRDITRL